MSINSEYEEQVNDAIFIFNNVNCIDNLQKLNIDYLKGKIIATNYNYKPLEKESQKIITELIKMNNLGFITVSSQPGELSKTSKQRGYVRGYILKKKIDEFEKTLYSISDNIYIRLIVDFSLIEKLKRINTYPEWYWITEKNYIPSTHVEDTYIQFKYFNETDIYNELITYYYEIEVIDLEWGRENYIHKKIVTVLDATHTIE